LRAATQSPTIEPALPSLIKISGGREVNLKDDGQKLLLSGANGIISAGYLTMGGNTVKKDTKMINEINLET
jgi:biotin synthase